MRIINRRNATFLAVLVLGIGLCVVSQLIPLQPGVLVNTERMPLKAGSWVQLRMNPARPQPQAPDGATAREWVFQNERAVAQVLLILPTENHRHGVHDPEYCYAGSGWIVAKRRIVDGLYPMTEVLLEKKSGGPSMLERYAFITTGRICPTVWSQIRTDFIARLKRKAPPWALLRIWCINGENAEKNLDSLCSKVAAALINSSNPHHASPAGTS